MACIQIRQLTNNLALPHTEKICIDDWRLFVLKKENTQNVGVVGYGSIRLHVVSVADLLHELKFGSSVTVLCDSGGMVYDYLSYEY